MGYQFLRYDPMQQLVGPIPIMLDEAERATRTQELEVVILRITIVLHRPIFDGRDDLSDALLYRPLGHESQFVADLAEVNVVVSVVGVRARVEELHLRHQALDDFADLLDRVILLVRPDVERLLADQCLWCV